MLCCCLGLTLSMEQLFVVLDLVLHLLVDLSSDVASFCLCGPLAFLLLLLLDCGELLEGFGIKDLLVSCLLLAEELPPELCVCFSLSSLQGYLLLAVPLVKSLPELCFFLLVSLVQAKSKLSQRVGLTHSQRLATLSMPCLVKLAFLLEVVQQPVVMSEPGLAVLTLDQALISVLR